jgi:peptidoglycan hydrolase-like protein with peptidoglycan-binding domain
MKKSLRTLAASAALLAVTMGPALAQNTKPAASAAPAKTEAKAKAPKAMKHAAWTKDQIKAAQEGLAKGGYYKGQPTGIMNKPTQAALRAWQKANKMPVNGRLSDDELAKLQAS